jgi:hypothetical protein
MGRHRDYFKLEKIRRVVNTSSGYIIEGNKNYLFIASEYNPQDSEDKFSEIAKIPKTWIRKRKSITSLS